ncbi:MAG: ABC transporter permease [Clostridiales bacterium]|nr:ABC transporter permease [Clostridiales bacterium]
MAVKETKSIQLSADDFTFVHKGERITDKQFEDKPVSYMKDAWRRFCKNKASVAAAVIIICIVLYAFITPMVSPLNSRFMDSYYSKKAPRTRYISALGILDGGVGRDFSEKGLVRAVGIGVGAEDWAGTGQVTIGDALKSKYQPMLWISDPVEKMNAKKEVTRNYSGKIDVYLEVGFMYLSVSQKEYEKIVAYEKESGLHILYPLVEDNQWNADASDANNWFKTKKNAPVHVNEKGKGVVQDYSEDLILEDNYKRDADGNPIYYEYTGGGTLETAQFKVRALYYNYYVYKNGFEPYYFLGTDSQGYDLALRLAGGIKLSLLVAICVSVINFIIGAMYGAVEGYYGGWVDMLMERVSDILGGVPFIVVATLFQIHLSNQVGPIVSLLFAFVLTGWLGTAYRVRTQFYRFKKQEYVLAARTLGARDRRIIWRHIFPNSLGTIITSCALVIPGVISSESMLSFLGIVKLGSAGSTSLGTLLADSSAIWTNYPHLMICPAIVLSLLMICFNLFGNGLRDAFNPSLRGVED